MGALQCMCTGQRTAAPQLLPSRCRDQTQVIKYGRKHLYLPRQAQALFVVVFSRQGISVALTSLELSLPCAWINCVGYLPHLALSLTLLRQSQEAQAALEVDM